MSHDQPCPLCRSTALRGLSGRALWPSSLAIHTHEELRCKGPGLPVPGAIQLVCSGRGSPFGGSALCGTESGTGGRANVPRTIPGRVRDFSWGLPCTSRSSQIEPYWDLSRIGSDRCSLLTKVGSARSRNWTRTGRPAGDAAFVVRVETITGRDLSKGKPGRPRKRQA